MSLNVIPSDISNLTPGEKGFVKKIKQLYSTIEYESYLYIQPRLKHLNPDFILIDAYKGVCVIEIKDWDAGYIEKVDNFHVWDVSSKMLDNPAFKAVQYLNFTKNILQSKKVFFDENGQFYLKVYSRLIFSNMSNYELERFNPCFYQVPVECIGSDQLRFLSIDKLFSEDSLYMDEEVISRIRSLFFPEIKIKPVQTKLWNFSRKKDTTNPFRATLDGEQEKFARQIPYGHYMITGVPGSGKTVILLARAIHLVKEKPSWNIRILTYNKSLANQLEKRFESLHEDLELMGINYHNIKISTFHALATEVSTKPIPVTKDNDYWKFTLPLNAIESAIPTYDAILIDEYQDFLDHWIKLCLLLCKKHEYNGNFSENLFLAGDRLQSIYNDKDHSWKSLGINIVGRSKLLKTSYRSGSNHINLALDYLMKDEKLKKEVEKFYEGRDNIVSICETDNSIEFIKGNIDIVNEHLLSLLTSSNYTPQDVLILVPHSKGKNGTEEIYKKLDKRLRVVGISAKETKTDRMDVITYHSSKGLECKVCFLLNVDSIEDKKLLYVGMTRASEKLFIHTFLPEGGTIFNELLSCYNEMILPIREEIVTFENVNISTDQDKKVYSIENIREKHPNAYKQWDRKEEFKLIELYDSGKSLEEIANILGRKESGIRSRLKKLGYFEEEVKLSNNDSDTLANPTSLDKGGSEKENISFHHKPEEKSNSTNNISRMKHKIDDSDPYITTKKRGFFDKIKKLTSFFIRNEVNKDQNHSEKRDIGSLIIEESSQKWVYASIDYFEKTKKYKLNDTSKKTYELLNTGKSVNEIADMRKLKMSTIIDHLLSLSLSGIVIPHKLIDNEIPLTVQGRIIEVLHNTGFTSKKSIKEMVGDECEYHHIDLMIALLISYNKSKEITY